MKTYISPAFEEFSLEIPDIITASGEGIVYSFHQSQSSQTIESEWKDSWN